MDKRHEMKASMLTRAYQAKQAIFFSSDPGHSPICDSGMSKNEIINFYNTHVYVNAKMASSIGFKLLAMDDD